LPPIELRRFEQHTAAVMERPDRGRAREVVFVCDLVAGDRNGHPPFPEFDRERGGNRQAILGDMEEEEIAALVESGLGLRPEQDTGNGLLGVLAIVEERHPIDGPSELARGPDRRLPSAAHIGGQGYEIATELNDRGGVG
jgi:hypothetical protein